MKETRDYVLTYRRDAGKHPVFTVADVRDFNTDHIFDCGQCFRWRRREDGSYTGIAGGRLANIAFAEAPRGAAKGAKGGGAAKGGGTLRITELAGKSEPGDFDSFWAPYLDLGRDYAEIKKKVSRGDEVMKAATRHGYGIRILKQELWETIVSFIISQNNNIPRIKGCIEKLAAKLGEPLVRGAKVGKLSAGDLPEDLALFNLPGPERLARATEEDLAEVRLGYRSRYLIETAKAVCERGLPETMEELSALCGVGPKVANCIGLFGMNRTGSFPVDVWMKRIMSEEYGFAESDMRGMEEYAERHFGEYSGFAQQYLFYYARSRQYAEKPGK